MTETSKQETKKTAKPILFALNSNRPLAKKISEDSGIPLGKATINHFSDGEIQAQIDESIRGDDVYVVQSLSAPINDNFMELLIMIDAIRRTSAKTINVVMPYYGYSRFDLKNKPREPITAKMLASLMQRDGMDRLITVDLHDPQIQGFFDIPVDHLRSNELVADYIVGHGMDENAVVVSPDYNGVARARGLASILNLPIGIVDNRHPEDPDHQPDEVIGDVKGKDAIIFDDMIVSGRTMITSAKALKKNGVKHVYAFATHGVFEKDALKNISDPAIDKVIVSDSIKLSDEFNLKKLDVVSIGELIGQALKLIQNNESTSKLFN